MDYAEPNLKNAAAHKCINIMNVILNEHNKQLFSCQQRKSTRDQSLTKDNQLNNNNNNNNNQLNSSPAYCRWTSTTRNIHSFIHSLFIFVSVI